MLQGYSSGLALAEPRGVNPALARWHLTIKENPELPHGLSEREAMLLLDALARLKERRFGRLTLTISDGRVVDVEVIEKIDHDLLRRLSM